MFKTSKKAIAVMCALALVIAMLPVQQAQAAKAPAFAKTYASLYENTAKDGVYAFTVKNLEKGQIVKWTLKGKGSIYATLSEVKQVATSTSVTNTVTIRTNGVAEAVKKKVKVVARVYTKTGGVKTLDAKLVNIGKIKICPTDVAITGDLASTDMYAGQEYQLGYEVTPATATGKRIWSATDADGNEVSCITEDGLFTPAAEGEYTITVSAYTGVNLRASDSVTVTVTKGMTKVEQITANKIVATYSGDVSDTADASDFELTDASGSVIGIDSVEFSDDGTEVTITAGTCFEDGGAYTLSDTCTSCDFVASVGTPAELVILTDKITINKDTHVLYEVCDENGIDVSAAYPGEAVIDYGTAEITNGYVCEGTDMIYMGQLGKTGTFTLVYTYSGGEVSAEGTVTCALPDKSTDTCFTLTDSSDTPDYADPAYSDNRTAVADTTYYAHFYALDFDGEPLVYDKVAYKSSDPDTLIIDSSTGKVTAVTPGSVTITVTATYAGQAYTYLYDVDITDAIHLGGIALDDSAVKISNTDKVSDYCVYIGVTATDQGGNAYALSGEKCEITALNTASSMPVLSYDAENDRIVVTAKGSTAGTYSYIATVTCGGYSETAGFTVTVQVPSSTANSTYAIESSTVDLAITDDTSSASSKDVVIRVAEYKGGIFYQYCDIVSATVEKDGVYFSSDLTALTSAGEVWIEPEEDSTETGDEEEAKTSSAIDATRLTLTALSLDEDGKIKKAETGTYSVTIKFSTSSDGSTATIAGTFTLTDAQASPTINVKYRTGNAIYSDALSLAKYCLEIVDMPNATIAECAVTGTNTLGSGYALSSGEQVNIRSVTIRVNATIDGTAAYYECNVDGISKTLTNG